MTKQAVEAIIGRAVLDSDFRESLFANPDLALGGYDLSDDEVTALKAVDAETMESFAGALDSRISKAVIASGFGGGQKESLYDPLKPGEMPATGPQPM